MSASRPELLPYGEGNLLEGIPDTMPHDPNKPPSKTPDGWLWAEHVGRSLGYSNMRTFPVYFDGSGCCILKRDDLIAAVKHRINLEHPTRRFKYLALLDVEYEDGIVVAIRDEAVLLQFYRLVHPMLMLQTATRFRGEERERSGFWERGREWAKICANQLKWWRQEHPNAK